MPPKNEKTQTLVARKSPAAAKTLTWTPAQMQQIAERAYYYFLSRGGHHGNELEDWLHAESDFAATLNSTHRRRKSAEAARSAAS